MSTPAACSLIRFNSPLARTSTARPPEATNFFWLNSRFWELGQLFDRKQRRRLEREHREGAAQDIGQLIAAVGSPMIRQPRKFFTQGLHQVIEGDFLL